MSIPRFDQRLRLAPRHVQNAWQAVSCDSCAILDAYSAAWLSTPASTRARVMRAFDAEGLVPALIHGHIQTYATARSQALVGLGAAIRAYREAGIHMEVPAAAIAPNPNTQVLHLAAIAQMLEQDSIGRADYQWLREEVVRLGRACINWIEMERQREALGEPAKVVHPDQILDEGAE